MSKNTKELNDSHIYTFIFYVDGEKIDIHVNDLLPYFNGYICYASTGSNELYIPLIEKAWAKIFNSYENIIAGTTSEAFRALSG